MRFEYDPEVDILTVELGDMARLAKTDRLPNGVIVDYAEDGTILSLEIMSASKKYPLDKLQVHPANYEEPISLAEAAKIADCTPDTIKKAILRGRMHGQKIGRNWTTTIAALTEYLNSRVHEGPGSAVVAERSPAVATSTRKPRVSK